MGAALLVGLGIDQQHVGDRPVGDVDLRTVEHVVVAVAAGRCAHGTQRIRARAGLGQAERADLAPRAQAGKVLSPLLLVAVSIDVVEAEIVVRHPRQGHRVVPAAEALQHQTGGEKVEAGAAILFGDRDAEQSVVADLGKGLLGPPFLRVHARRQVVEFVSGEPVGLIEDRPLVFVEVEGERPVAPGIDSLPQGHAFLPVLRRRRATSSLRHPRQPDGY